MNPNYSNHSTGNRSVFLLFITFVFGIFCAAQMFGAEIQAIGPSAPALRYKLRVSDRSVASQLYSSDAALIADYGSFQLLRVNETVVAEYAGQPGVEDVTEQNVIALNTGPLDTFSPEVMALRTPLALRPGKQLHLVQFAGPIKPEWREALEHTGVQVITYIPQNAYLIYGDASALGAMQTWAAGANYVQWEGPYLDDYKIHPAARSVDAKGQPMKPLTNVFAIQLVADSDANAVTLGLIDGLKLEPIYQQAQVLGYLDIVVKLPPDRVANIAAQPEVVSIQAYPEPKKKDERQDMIMSGNLSGNVPSGPGYLAWLASKGFTQAQFTASGFAIDLSDSGIDNGTTTPGHFGLYLSGDSTLASRVIYNRLVGTPHSGSTLQGCDGHGNLNSHIMAGYNNQPTGFPHTDASGFHYGLGVCPFVKVGSSVIFDPGSFTSPSYENLQSMAYNDGARISGNSWGASVAGAYNTDSQRYDALVRDAQPAGSPFPTAGNQEMVIVFAAGNDGSGASTVGSPGTAKNVFTIGAAENVHSHATSAGGNTATGSDGCAIVDTGADNANDIISFSSRGPCTDGRKKPEIMAPGTHVTGGVGQTSPPPSPTTTGSAIACFDGSGVCGLNGSGGIGNANNFFPLSQQFFTTSSGTSHSTPGISGSCALLRQYFINQSLTPPSPAMTKAYLMNSARYMNGAGANDTLPSNNQGTGEVNLGTAFDGTTRVLRDELAVDKFTATGQTRTFAGTVVSGATPFRVTLAWTDAPGNTSGNSYNNDLDLSVTVGGTTYKGNVFSGANSIAGGTADAKDNVESVFVPAGVSGSFVVTVTAANINSDGVPNEAPSLDQDFALVIYNANLTPTPVISADTAAISSESCTPTNNAADPGETLTVYFALRNVGSSNTANVVATLLVTNGVASPSAPQNYGALLAGGAAVSMPFTFAVNSGCGTTISPTLHLQDGALDLGNVSFFMPLGQPATAPFESFDGVSAPALPAGWTTTASGGQSAWVTSTSSSDSAPNSAFATDGTSTGVTELVSPAINVSPSGSQVSFRHSFSFENGYDGGVLEISINGGGFADILTAGGSFVSGGYTRALNSSANPLSTRQAWSGSSGGYITTLVNLPSSANGLPAQLKWRSGCDSSIGSTGWFLDTITVVSRACCGTLAPPIASFTGSPTNGVPPLTVTFTDNSTGTITNRFWNFGNGVTSNTLLTTVSTTYSTVGTNTVSLTASGPLGVNTMTRNAYIIVTNPVAVIVSNGFALVTESCPNGAIDAGETVTVNVALKNNGGGPAANLVATLLASGGIAGPSGPRSYGALSAGGGAASRSFTFTALGSCGSTDIATLQLQDGANNLGTVTFSFPLGNVATTLAQNFDGVTAPALPAGWTTAASGSQSLWVSSTAQSDTVPNSVFSPDPGAIGVNEILTPTINGGTKLTFRHNFNTEAGFDGGVLEISINGGAFSDILAAGGTFVTNGYNRTLSTSYNNPLAGRQAWSGTSNGFVTTIVGLPAAAASQPFQLKWRCGSDSSISSVGWYIDTVNVTGLSCCTGPAILLKPRLAGDGRLMFDLTGPAGNYQIESSIDLVNWAYVTTVANPTGQVTFTEPGPPGDPFRTFRAKLLP